MRKISFWRYSAVNRQILFAALACALLVFGTGCGTSNKLQSIQLSTSNQAEGTIGAQNLQGITSTIQLYAWGNYSDGKSKLLNDVGDVTWSIILDPVYDQDAFGNLLPSPPETVELSTTGLLTAVDPAYCTWLDVAQVTTQDPTPAPTWVMSGQYDVTVSYSGFTSPPVAVAVADTGGSPDYPPGDSNNENNPSGQCGPSQSQ
jgi:hypothetical protein